MTCKRLRWFTLGSALKYSVLQRFKSPLISILYGVKPAYKRTIEELKHELIEKLGDRISSLILYGSAAKDDMKEESDIDILIITKDNDNEIYDEISKIRTDVDLKNGSLTSLISISRREIEEYLKLNSPFIKDVIKEGVILYDDGTFRKLSKSVTGKIGKGFKSG